MFGLETYPIALHSLSLIAERADFRAHVSLAACQLSSGRMAMTFNRRDLLKGGLTLTLASQASFQAIGEAGAQAAWPNRNITVIVPFPPGGQADLAARPIAA